MKFEEILLKEAYIISKAAKNLDQNLYKIVDLVHENVINNQYTIITGIGKNSDIAKKISATYSSIGIHSIYLDSYNALHGDLGSVLPGQIILGFSKSGETPELLMTFEACGNKKCTLVSLTCSYNSSLGIIAKKFNGYDIVVPCEFEADALNLAPTCSSTLLLSVGDAIGILVSEKLNLTKDKFLENHPAGNLGKILKEELHK